MLVGLAALAGAAPAGAGAGTGPGDREAVVGTLAVDGRPVAGAEVRVAAGDRTIGRSTSSTSGRFRIDVPGPGTYRVSIVVGSLPAGVRLADGAPRSLPRVVVQPGADKRVVFRLVGASTPARRTTAPASRFAVVLLAGLRFGVIVAVAAAGLTIVFGTTGIVNLAHGEYVTFGAVAAWYASAAGLPLLAAGVVAVLAGAAFGWSLDAALWRPLRRRGTDASTVMVITIGLSLFLRNAYLLVLKGPSRAYRDYAVQDPWVVGGVRILPKTPAIVAIGVATLLVVAWFLRRTRAGRAIRAVGDDPTLATVSGIDEDRTASTAWTLAAALAAIGGVLLGSVEGVQWDMGLRLLLVMAAAAVVGGLGDVRGALVGGLVVGFASELSTYWLPTDAKLLVSLVILIGVLLVRPRGILARPERFA